MALSQTDSLASFSQSGTAKLDISPVLATVLLYDTALLGLIGMGEPALRAEHRYNEDKLNAYFVTENDGAANFLDAAGATTVINLNSGDGAKLRIGAMLKDQSGNSQEVLQVTAINVDQITTTRGLSSTTVQAHSGNAVWTIVGQPVQEGDETINDISRGRTQVTQYTAIFKRTVKVSGTIQAETANGMHAGVPDEAKYQILHRTLELKRELDISAIQSVISTNAGSNTVYRTMRGLRQFLVTPPQGGSGNSIADSESLTEAVVNKLYRRAWNQGGDPRDLVGGPDQITRFADFNAGKVRVAASDRIAGVFIEKYLTQYGAELSLTLDRWMPQDEVALIDKSRCHVALLQGRGLIVEPLAKIGDAQRWQVLMEATLVVKNADLAHAYHTNLTVPIP